MGLKSLHNLNLLQINYWDEWSCIVLNEACISRDINIHDTMIQLMEKYAGNLEEIVDKKSQLLIDERIKTEQLLYKILPRYAFD